EVRARRYRVDLDKLAGAVLPHLTQTKPFAGGFSAAVLLQGRSERGLFHLALAERGISTSPVDSAASLEELVRLAPGMIVADPSSVFLRRPKGPFDLVFLGPALSSRRISRQALSRLYGPDVGLCPI